MKNKIMAVILALLLVSVAYAATRSLVPRADGEGSLGTSSKNWLSAYIDTLLTNKVTFTDNNASPTAVGELLYDNTVANVDDGWFCWYDDDEIKYLIDTNNLPTDSEDDYHLAYDKDTDKMYWKADADTGGATAWDNITNPTGNDEIDFAAHVIELNVENFQIGDGGANYVDFDGTPTITFAGNADIDLPNNSVDLADLATAAYAKDIVTTSPITGATDNVLVGADSDVTIALTLLKDIVTTSPITGGENDVLPGADADLTIALTLLKDLVTTAPITGGTNDIFPGADADITVALDFTAAWDFGGATSLEIPNAADPDVDAAGEISNDTDGANETGDVIVRGFDGTNQFPIGQKIVTLNFTLISPDTIDAADLIPIWHNTSGMTFTIVEWKAWSDDDDVSLEIEELTDQTDYTARTLVDAVEIATDGTGVYYASDGTITHAAIEHDHGLAIDFDTSDTPDYVQMAIKGWFNADVN